MYNFNLIESLIRVPIILICMTVHELAHGFVAYKLGDMTAKNQGRLTLNPLAHIDWVGALSMLFLGFGWAKPVPVNPYEFKKGGAKGMVWVSLAGPVSNIILSFISFLLFYILSNFVPLTAATSYIFLAFNLLAVMNIYFAVFNLIPVPPLDGSHVLKYFLPYNGRVWLEQYKNILFMILIMLSFVGWLSYIIVPVSNIFIKLFDFIARSFVGLF